MTDTTFRGTELVNPLLLHNTNSLINDFVSVNCKWFKLCIAHFFIFFSLLISGKIGCDRRDIRGRDFVHSYPKKNLYDFFFNQLRMGCKAENFF